MLLQHLVRLKDARQQNDVHLNTFLNNNTSDSILLSPFGSSSIFQPQTAIVLHVFFVVKTTFTETFLQLSSLTILVGLCKGF